MAERRLRAGSATDVGLKRQRNEDSVLMRPEAGLWAVADGMGGHGGGDVASRMAVDSLARFVEGETAAERLATLERAVIAANNAMRAYAKAHGRAVMGTTLVALLASQEHFAVLWCGDSRAYLLRDATLTQLSQDQTLVAKLVSDGTLTQEEADHSPMHNVILQALGTSANFKPLIGSQGLPLQQGDIFILCSDGVSNLVPDVRLAEMASRLPPQEACQAIIEAALAAGGNDNASLGVFSVCAPAEPDTTAKPTTRRIKIPAPAAGPQNRSAGSAGNSASGNS